jgi:hypothetical protein
MQEEMKAGLMNVLSVVADFMESLLQLKNGKAWGGTYIVIIVG